jgi:hypothetical protein
MLPVSESFKAAVHSSHRQILGQVQINFSNPFLDPSVVVTVSDQAYHSWPLQVTDANNMTNRKWASLDGSWVLDGTWYLGPDTVTDAAYNQMGWWGAKVSGPDGSFNTPYPEITVDFSARALHLIEITGDIQRHEYPVDFTIRIYNGADLVNTQIITGNNQVFWSINLSYLTILSVTKFALTISKWSRGGTNAKIAEFFTTLNQTYSGSDIFQMNLLEEREFSTGTLPIGNIASNELVLRLNNAHHLFDAGNTDSPFFGLILPNRRLKVSLGVIEPDGAVEWVPLGVFWSGEWTIPDDDIYMETTAFDRLNLLTSQIYKAPVYQNISAYDLAAAILDATGYIHSVDPVLADLMIPYAWFEENTTFREALRQLAEATISQVYVDRDDIVQFQGPTYLQNNQTTSHANISRSQYTRSSNPVNRGQLANYITVPVSPFVPEEYQEVYQSSEPIPVAAGETVTITVSYSKKPVVNASASISDSPLGLVIMDATYYAWGADITVGGAIAAGTFMITVTGTPLGVAGARNITAQDAASIQQNGVQIYAFKANHLIQTAAMAQKVADTCLMLSKSPRRDLELDWQGDPALELGDRITVPNSKTTTADFYIVSNELTFDGGLSAITKGKRVML